MEITPNVTAVKALEDFKLYLKFADGKEKVYDMSNLIETNSFYKNLKNVGYFSLVKPRGISVEWPNGEDVCPENLYNESEDFIK